MVRLHAGASSANTCPLLKGKNKKKRKEMASLPYYAFFSCRKPALRASATRARVIRMHNTYNETLICLMTLAHGLSNRANIHSLIYGGRELNSSGPRWIVLSCTGI